MKSDSDWTVLEETWEYILIKDLDLGNKSVTNDAENIVDLLMPRINVKGHTKKLFYIDSMGSLDEIIIKNKKFAGFRPGIDYYGIIDKMEEHVAQSWREKDL